MKILKDISYSDIGHERQVLDLYLPDCEEFPVFIYFHGGGIENGGKDIAWAQQGIISLVKKGVAVVMANYRLYPSAVYPDFIRDAAAAVAWTYKHINEYGKCKGYYVGGSSAGGYISQMLCFDKKYLGVHNIDPSTIDGFIHDAGQPTAHFNVMRERGFDTRRVVIDETCPIYHIGTAEKYAPMLILVATNDMENRYEQTMLLVSTMKHFRYDMDKVELKVLEGTHCSYTQTTLPELVYEYITKK